MNINTLISHYKKGDRLYFGVLCRHFGYDKAREYVTELTESGLFSAETLYKCPECDFALFGSDDKELTQYNLSQEKIFCYACDREINVANLSSSPLLIRTAKDDVESLVDKVTADCYSMLGIPSSLLNTPSTATEIQYRETFKRLYGHYPDEQPTNPKCECESDCVDSKDSAVKYYLNQALLAFESIKSCKYAPCEQCKHYEDDSDPFCENGNWEWKYAEEVKKLLNE